MLSIRLGDLRRPSTLLEDDRQGYCQHRSIEGPCSLNLRSVREATMRRPCQTTRQQLSASGSARARRVASFNSSVILAVYA